MVSNNEILATFFLECDEQLQLLEDGLGTLKNGHDQDNIHRIFRAVHSIKGGAASLGLTRLAEFSHIFEDILSDIRCGHVVVDEHISDIFLHAKDILTDLVSEARDGHQYVTDDNLCQISGQLAELGARKFNGKDINISEHTAVDDFKPLPVAFDFDDEEMKSSDYAQQNQENDDTGDRPSPTKQEKIRCEINTVLGQKSKSAKIEQRSLDVQKKYHQTNETIRVNLDKVDTLMNLVGELVIAQSSLENTSSSQRVITHMETLARDLQESVMSIRAQPVSTVFTRMKRVVREASQATGKKVRLIIEGEETEIDRTLVEQLVDPLTHILRNAVDHGIETPSLRQKEGKLPYGELKLKAEQKSGRIIISISDDGGGINREKVKEIALAKGLIQPDETLSVDDIDNLICAPGFSTIEHVTDLSGRGVGMDVVRSIVQTLGGKMMIKSAPQKGTELSLSMPLTLAVMDGMLIKAGSTVLVVALSAISGIVQIDEAMENMTTPDGRRLIHVRKKTLPLINMAASLGLPTHNQENCLLITEDETGGGAFEVEDIIDQKQVVIKSLEKNYHKINGVSGATILGDGSVALIIDPGALIHV